jgi:hypothetical protein
MFGIGSHIHPGLIFGVRVGSGVPFGATLV